MLLFPSVLALLLACPASPQDHPNRASPFEAIRWEEEQPIVQVDGVWYRPLAVDGVAVERIVAACEERWPGQLRKRFSEDLMEAMARLGAEPGALVALELERVSDGAVVVREDVPNTLAKRQALWAHNTGVPVDAELSREAALAELDAFADGLRERFAYLELRGVELDGELERVAADLGDPAPAARIAEALHLVLMRFGDGHASVTARDFRPGERGPFLPFLMAESSAGVVAFAPGRESFLDPERPLVVALAGFPLEDCLAAVRPYVCDGSPQLVRRRSLRLLRDASLWYPLVAGREVVPPSLLDVELAASADGDDARTVAVATTDRKPIYGEWPRARSALLDDSVGYLRLASMDEEAVAEVHRWMQRFRDTRGLVVDVRGNGGGSREALLALAGYLIGPDEPPRVGNVAAYRLAEAFDEDHLDARFLYRADDARWTDAQRAAIERVRAEFEPEWTPPGGFSDWHYLVLDRTRHDGAFLYDRPVAILSDAGCFSATDVFLGALELLPRVTLVGTASSGGSARSQEFRLHRSGLRVRCASMASFRPDGRLYDGRGVEVDVEVPPDPKYFLQGGPDAALESALELLRGG